MEPEHVLLGLLMVGESSAAKFLRDSRVNLWKLRWDLQRHLATLPKGQAVGLSSVLQSVSQQGASEAEKDGSILIGTLYLMLGLMETKNAFAYQLLLEAGVTTEAIRKQIAAPADL